MADRAGGEWDVFISHASEDKETIARPLAKALEARGLRVWFDEFTLSVGDRLRRSIDRGLANSRYGIVILSPMFFAKEWPQKELDGLVQREERGEKVILPVWHNITAEKIRAYSPTLADRIAVSSSRGLDHVVAELLRGMGGGPKVLDLVRVPAGEFLMGSDPAKDGMADGGELPQHPVYLPEYRISRCPITHAQYAEFVTAAGHRQPPGWENGTYAAGRADHPVVNVSWDDAAAFCRWAAQETGSPVRLPTEAEWEKAARGSDGRIYPWGDQEPTAELCNFGMHVGDTTPAGRYPKGASPYGVLDMAGNVWEWTSSQYRRYPYKADDGREDPESREARMLRGGSFWIGAQGVRCAFRGWLSPNYRNDSIGFRVASPGF